MQIFVAKIKYLFRICLWIIVLVGVVVGIVVLGRIAFPKVVYQPQVKEVVLDNLTGKVNQLKGELVISLKQCESQGYNEESGLVTFDPHPTNKKVQPASFGLYQFKVSTIQYYYKKFYNQEVSGKQAILIALDDQKSSELASDIIFRDGALSNWYNCSKKLGLEQKWLDER